jgi:hypothetical protein
MGEAATRPHRLGYEIIVLRLLARRQQGEIGPDLFRAACDMGLEGLVSKRRDALSGWRVEALAAHGQMREISHGIGLNATSRKMPSLRFRVSQPWVGWTRQRAGGPGSLALLELQKQIYHHGHFWREGAVGLWDHRAILYESGDGMTGADQGGEPGSFWRLGQAQYLGTPKWQLWPQQTLKCRDCAEP